MDKAPLPLQVYSGWSLKERHRTVFILQILFTCSEGACCIPQPLHVVVLRSLVVPNYTMLDNYTAAQPFRAVMPGL